MNNVSNSGNFDIYNTHTFEIELPRKQLTEVWKLEKSEDAARLQNLFDLATKHKDDKVLCSKYINEYQSELDKLQRGGKREFTLTKGHVYELVEHPEHKKLEVPIQMQVKEGVLTWYFKAPMDVTKQTFRDEVFLAAGLAHVNVDHARFRYLRGTNSLHVKLMHTKEQESLMNHNHYILDKGVDFTPERLKQHLDGFVKAERELTKGGYIKDVEATSGKEKFLTQEEADAIVEEYKKHWAKINEKVEDQPSLLQEKKTLRDKRLTKEDKHEWVKYNYEFNTVIASGYKKVKGKESSEDKVVKDDQGLLESETYLSQKSHFTINPDWPLEKRIKAVKLAMRGGFSNRAQVRQMAGSELHALAEITKMNDEVKIDQKSTATTKIATPEKPLTIGDAKSTMEKPLIINDDKESKNKDTDSKMEKLD